jgi:hypothetical protein
MVEGRYQDGICLRLKLRNSGYTCRHCPGCDGEIDGSCSDGSWIKFVLGVKAAVVNSLKVVNCHWCHGRSWRMPVLRKPMNVTADPAQ